MASYHSGKDIDYTSEWTKWSWDNRGFWISSRYGPSGEIEYDYDETTPPPANQQDRESTPRFPGEADIPSVTSLYGSPSDNTPANSFTPDSPSYTTAVKSSSPLTETWGQDTSAKFQSQTEFDPLPASSSASQDYFSSKEVTAGLEDLSLGPSSPFPAGFQGKVDTQAQWESTDESASADIRHRSLDPRYKIIEAKKLSKFWKVGRVFMTLWVEPARDFAPQPKPTNGPISLASQFATTQATSETGSYLGGISYSEIRRFVVLGTNYGNAQCSPIHTYGNQACLKPNLPDVNQHAIIYTSEHPPNERRYIDEKGVEIFEGLSKIPIKVVSERTDQEGDLGVNSRLNYSKVYTIEFYARVLNIGMVHRDYLETLTANSFVKLRAEPPQGPKRRPSNRGKNSGHKSKGGPSRSSGKK